MDSLPCRQILPYNIPMSKNKTESIKPERQEFDGIKPYKWNDDFCEDLVKHMSKGLSYTTWGVAHNISTTTMYEWEGKIPKWKDAKTRGYAAGQIFFEKLLISSTMGVVPEELKKAKSKGINLSAVIFALKTRFHKEYSEKIEVDNTSSDGSQKVTFVMPPTEEGEEYKVKKIVTT